MGTPIERRKLRDELRVHLSAQRELGPEMEEATVASFLDKLERQMDARIEAKLAQRLRLAQRERRGATITLVVTLGMAIPLSAVTLPSTGLPGLAIIWACLIFLNLYRR